MLYLADGSRRYSPKDLIAYLEGDFAAWMERAALERGRGRAIHEDAARLAPDPDDPELGLLKRAGIEHEKRFLQRLLTEGRRVVEIPEDGPRSEKTLEAMRAGVEVIYQAYLQDGAFHGLPVFLFRVEGRSSLGDFHYEPRDTKLARSAKPYFLVQLCGYAELLRAVQDVLPDRLGFHLGDQTDLIFETERFLYYFRHLRNAFLRFQSAFDSRVMPDPGLERSFGRWSEAAARILEARDHLRQVARITRGQIVRLEQAGITTMAKLAADRRSSVSRVASQVFARLRTQAALQIESRGQAVPTWRVVPPAADEPFRGLGGLPPADPCDVFFDMEGFPLVDGGLEYLFGAVTVDGGSPEFHDRWGHDEAGEKRAFEGFVDWAWGRWRSHPGLHIYHYAPYEPSALRRLMGKHATREDQVDDLLRHEVFVDLYAVVRHGVIVGTPSYSLKDIERLYRPGREGDVITAGGSVVEYQRWIDSGEPADPEHSPVLRGIRDYNRDDCESTWQLAEWLRARQREHRVPYAPPKPSTTPTADLRERTPAELLAEELLARADALADSEEGRVTRLLAHLLGFHRREEKPMWWRLFARRVASEEDLYDDPDCLAGLVRTSSPRVRIDQSFGYDYSFDPDQDTKLGKGDKCFFAHDLGLRPTIEELDRDRGLVTLKLGPSRAAPDRGSLIPDKHIPSGDIQLAVHRFVEQWARGDLARGRAVDDLLRRRPPRLLGRESEELVDESRDLLPQLEDLAGRLDCTTLCIQGPPGTGKTWTSGRVITALFAAGARVGVASNSHKAILNLMQAVAEAADEAGVAIRLVKAGKGEAHPLVESGRIALCENSQAAGIAAPGPVVLGGTAWAFCRAEMDGVLDYLFVDEAGQVSLANLVGMGLSARSIVLVGDQMQLAQPTQGVHPGESGSSSLEYALQGHPTVPRDRGVFLGQTRRMHPDVNGFISAAVYEGRLTVAPVATRRRIALEENAKRLDRGTGVVVLEVPHEGNTQDSVEEVEVIRQLVGELERSTVVNGKEPRPFNRARDVLIVAPYNKQVRRLREALPAAVQVGSVDKFQGLEAPVVIVSMCSSTLEDAPRGASFLLSPNRLNVAISRAQCLAVVVASPGLWRTRCTTIAEMELLNLFCRLRAYARGEHG